MVPGPEGLSRSWLVGGRAPVETPDEDDEPGQSHGESDRQGHHRDAQPKTNNHEQKAQHNRDRVAEESFDRSEQMSVRRVSIFHGGSLPRNVWKLSHRRERPSVGRSKKPRRCDESHSGAAVAMLNLPIMSKENQFTMRYLEPHVNPPGGPTVKCLVAELDFVQLCALFDFSERWG
jgi:hypothetical protein